MLENLAGVVGGGNTFLTRNTEVIGGNKHLHLTFQLNDSEKSEGNKNSSCAGIYKVAFKKAGNGFREVYISGIVFTVAVIRKAAVKNNRRYNLNNRSRAVGSKSRAGKRIFGTENFYVSFASVKDNLFGKEGNAGNGIRCGNRGVICGKVYKEVKGHINRIKTPVERDGFHFEEHVKYFDAFCFNAERTVDFCLFGFGKINLKILKAIFINGLCVFNYKRFTFTVKGEERFRSVLLYHTQSIIERRSSFRFAGSDSPYTSRTEWILFDVMRRSELIMD